MSSVIDAAQANVDKYCGGCEEVTFHVYAKAKINLI